MFYFKAQFLWDGARSLYFTRALVVSRRSDEQTHRAAPGSAARGATTPEVARVSQAGLVTAAAADNLNLWAQPKQTAGQNSRVLGFGKIK